jgi:exodeoxyribonuclease VII large subunit
METTPISVSDAIALINQTLEYAYPTLVVEGEVSSFKVNQSKFAFFDIKDATGTLPCFMMVHQLRVPIEDGMTIRVVAQPKLTNWGKFSLTVRSIQPVGEGSLKRAFDLLLAKLTKEGLFDAERKRPLPRMPRHIAVIASTQSAGYADFMKILNDRWGGVDVTVAHVTVQGLEAPKQIVRAIEYCNQLADVPDAIIIIRGGGSLDDLSAFNDEPLVRAIAASRAPVMTGIGHEVDTSLADLAADVRAATPTNAATIIVPDRHDMMRYVDQRVRSVLGSMERRVQLIRDTVIGTFQDHISRIERRFDSVARYVQLRTGLIAQLDPKLPLERGYALMYDQTGKLITSAHAGQTITIETKSATITAGVENVSKKR